MNRRSQRLERCFVGLIVSAIWLLGAPLALAQGNAGPYPIPDESFGRAGGGGFQATDPSEELERARDQGYFEDSTKIVSTWVDEAARVTGQLDILYGDGGKSGCSATAIAPDLILTNEHCLTSENGAPFTHGLFLPGFRNIRQSQSVERYEVQVRVVEQSPRTALDFAILRLEKPIADWSFPEFSVRDPLPGEPLIIMGHPEKQPLLLSRGRCRSTKEFVLDGAYLNHECATLQGSSGSLVWSSGGDLIGLHSRGGSAFEGEVVNQAVRFSELVNASRRLRDFVEHHAKQDLEVDPDLAEELAQKSAMLAAATDKRRDLEMQLTGLQVAEAQNRADARMLKVELQASTALQAAMSAQVVDLESELHRSVGELAIAERQLRVFRNGVSQYLDVVTLRPVAGMCGLLVLGDGLSCTIASDGSVRVVGLPRAEGTGVITPPGGGALRGLPPFGIAWEHWLEGDPGAVGSVFRECGVCPEMVVMPAGRYLMGSPLGEGEDDERTSDGKRLDVRIQRFAMSRYEVSVDEYRRFVSHTQRNHPGGCWWFTKDKKWERREGNDWRSPGFAQGGTHPVACVSWDDAQAYIGWLNGLDGAEQYRLPSESEHEYATRGISGDSRGRTSTRYFWGDDNDLTAGCDYANGNDERGRAENGFSWQGFGCDDGFAQTSPVGSFSANGFGLYDMSGNVWEWVEDCWSEDLSGTPSDGGSRPSEHCDEISGREARVLRGGSWYNGPGNLRSANRDGGWPSFRFSSGGFRLSRTLTR